MQICKPFNELTRADKSILLHNLFPQEMKPFLLFVAAYLHKYATKQLSVEQWPLSHKSIPLNKWVEIIEALAANIDQCLDTLATDYNSFAACLARGHNQFFFLDALQEYTTLADNEQLVKAIDFLFDL